jgi:hypothetical protein
MYEELNDVVVLAAVEETRVDDNGYTVITMTLFDDPPVALNSHLERVISELRYWF